MSNPYLERVAAAAPNYSSLEKKAAFDALVEGGMNYDEAISAIEKEAGLVDGAVKIVGKLGASAKAGGQAIARDAGKIRQQVGDVGAAIRTPTSTMTPGKDGVMRMGIKTPLTNLARNRAVQTGAATAAVGGVGSRMASSGQEKQACIARLMNQGVDFDSAVEMTKQASLELYGE